MQRVVGVERTETSGRSRTLWQALARLGPYLEGLKLRWTLGLIAAIGAGIVALSIPQVLQVLVNSLLDDDAQLSAVWGAAAVILALGVLEAGLVYLRRFFVIPPASDAETSMRTRLFDKLQDLSASFHAAWGAGQLQSRAIADLNLLRRWFAFGSLMLITSVVSLLVGFTLMATLSPLLAVVFLCAALPIMIIGPRFRKKFVYYSRASQDQAGDVATKVEESVHGIRVLKAFGRGDYAQEGFTEEADELRDLEVSKARTLAKFLMAMVILPEGILGLCLLIGLWQVANQETTGVTIGALAAFFATAAVLKGPIEGVGMMLGMTFTAKTAIDRHADVMDTATEITSPEAPVVAPERGVLQLEDVHFRYPDTKPGDRDLIDGVTLEVRPGETMALVSATGGGTSTLLNLIPRLYEATGGAIRIDGVDVKDFSLADLRSRIGVAFEDPILFSTSVKSNVLLGTSHLRDVDDPQDPHRDAAPAPDELDEVLRRSLTTADAEFVDTLPRGVDTPVGEEGLSLSGGQRQRLALARAIASAPSVLLLDDPLSALDVRTEEAVTHRLREVLNRTTTLIVAHRPSTVAMADRVAMLEHGRISDVGTHSELLQRSPAYREVMSASVRPISAEEVLSHE
ncbi:ABC transporter [Nesterenkonia sp. AN1]|uniref:ATP-binding cassette subfamily B protein n=1 Tax=Nesterenkonia aurantiaca TaxID=1436010 RepID=A0A4V3ECL9_9MICC|nr:MULTISPECIES: ABC transporter ATP-binding protein [Nesterenkonia]EXF23954.1 ABC transporter [Nesterenkonia sp. AN1]TDS86992.1 ATP-binding cassette subfamily B protein [Nesterenkonia aurantiaca]